MLACDLAWDGQRFKAGHPQIPMQCARSAIADDVKRTGDWKSRHWQAARHGFNQHDAKSIGAARKDENVGACIDLRKRLSRARAKEMRLGISALQAWARRAVAYNDGRARQVEIEHSRQVLFDGETADIKENRSRQIEGLDRARIVERVI